jgi:hypothetical protein
MCTLRQYSLLVFTSVAVCHLIAWFQEKLDRAKNYARVMNEQAQLGAFVRLADYLLVEGMLDAAVCAVQNLLSLLTAHKQQARALRKSG